MYTFDTIDEVKQAFATAANKIAPNDYYGRQDFLNNIEALLDEQLSPDEVFDFLGTGCYKEVYDSYMQNIILKFCSEDNNTDQEQFIYDKAKAMNLDNVFAKTYFIAFPAGFSVKASNLITDDDEPQYLVGCELQEEVEVVCNKYDDTLLWYERDEKTIPRVFFQDQTEISPEIMKIFEDSDVRWLQAVINYYGDTFFHRFVQFISDYDITDFHCGNIGFIEDRPVILDWWSTSY